MRHADRFQPELKVDVFGGSCDPSDPPFAGQDSGVMPRGARVTGRFDPYETARLYPEAWADHVNAHYPVFGTLEKVFHGVDRATEARWRSGQRVALDDTLIRRNLRDGWPVFLTRGYPGEDFKPVYGIDRRTERDWLAGVVGPNGGAVLIAHIDKPVLFQDILVEGRLT